MEKLNIVELENFRYGLGMFCVKQGRKIRWGIMDTSGNIIIEPCWIEVGTCGCHEIVWLRKVGEKEYRFYDIVRRKFIPGIKCTMYCKRVITKKGKYYGLEDRDGNVLIPHKFKKLYILWTEKNDLVYTVGNYRKRGLFYADGTRLLSTRYDEILGRPPVQCDKISLCNILFPVRIADEWFFANASGERPLKRHYDCLEGINTKGYCIFGEKEMVNGQEYMRYGLIDQQENILIPAIYKSLYWRNDDHLLCYDGKYGVIDCHGNVIIPCIYNNKWSGPVKTQIVYTPIGNSKTLFVVDETGRVVLPPRDWLIQSWNGAFRVYDCELRRYGVYSSSGEKILPFEFDDIDMHWGDTLDYIAVRKDGEWYYVNSRNERVLL